MGDTLTIDGVAVDFRPGETVLDAANRAGIYLPQLCKEPQRPALGACRTCLVQIEGVRGFPASCSTACRAGMVVSTRSAEVEKIRRGVLELTRAMLTPGGGASPGTPGQLDQALERTAVLPGPYRPLHHYPVDDSKSFFVLERDLCILCGRCVDACQKVQHIGAIALIGKGHSARVGVFGDGLLESSICTSCGQCVATCPTGALHPKRAAAPAAREVETTCPYCGVGCGVVLRVDGEDRLLGMVDDVPDNPASAGMLCVKGRFGTGFVHHPSRLRRPLLRKGGTLTEVSWEEALGLVSERLAQYHGDEFAALASAKATNEDGYVMQKFVRAVMGTHSVDHCTRLCHSPSVEAMLVSLGSGATSNSYLDYEEAGCLMVVGSDSSSNHPVIAVRFRKAVQERGARLIVVNPKRIDLCDYADLWLCQNPGTDVALFNGLARIVLDEGWEGAEFIARRTENFAAWKESLAEYTPDRVARITGVPERDLYAAARWYARPAHGGSCLIWGMGVTQHTNGTANAHSLLNLALVTGQMGKPASGISPLRGQNNVQGCGDAGCVPDSLPGYQAVKSAAARAKFAERWGAPLPEHEGLRVTEMVEAAMAGSLKAMYIVGENPLLSEADLHHAREALSRLEFLVVQDLFLHETAEIADVVLPAASFAEKDGTFTNSERRVQRVRRAIAPVPETRPDWEIICEVARRVLARRGRPAGGFNYSGPAAIFDEMASLVPFLAGISYPRLERGGIQWPCPAADHPGTRYMYADDFPRGKGKFVPVLQGAAADELPDAQYPLILNTGRILYHWHGGTLTRRVDGLLALAPRLEISIHPQDASRLGLADGAAVRMRSRRGELTGIARITPAVRPGAVFVPFVRLEESAANFLTNSAHDPSARIPEYKVCAVRVEPDDGPAAAEAVLMGTAADKKRRR